MTHPTCCDIDLDDDWPDGWTPLEAVAIIKALDTEGTVSVIAFASAGLNTWEAVGMTAHAKARLMQALLEDDED